MGIYYSIQSKTAWELALQKGYLSGNREAVYEDFISSYQWMIGQMNKRLEHDGSYPVWLWLQAPDVSKEGHLKTGAEGVCLTLEIPDKQVLLSDFYAWHCVLDDYYCSLTEDEDEQMEAGQSPLSKEESWERIFQTTLFPTSEMWNNTEQVLQGVTGCVPVSKVINVQPFLAK